MALAIAAPCHARGAWAIESQVAGGPKNGESSGRVVECNGMDTALFVGEGFSCEIHSHTGGLQRGSRLAADMDLRKQLPTRSTPSTRAQRTSNIHLARIELATFSVLG